MVALAAIPHALLGELFTRRPVPEIGKRLFRDFAAGLEIAVLTLSTAEPDAKRTPAIVREALRVIACW